MPNDDLAPLDWALASYDLKLIINLIAQAFALINSRQLISY